MLMLSGASPGASSSAAYRVRSSCRPHLRASPPLHGQGSSLPVSCQGLLLPDAGGQAWRPCGLDTPGTWALSEGTSKLGLRVLAHHACTLQCWGPCGRGTKAATPLFLQSHMQPESPLTWTWATVTTKLPQGHILAGPPPGWRPACLPGH